MCYGKELSQHLTGFLAISLHTTKVKSYSILSMPVSYSGSQSLPDVISQYEQQCKITFPYLLASSLLMQSRVRLLFLSLLMPWKGPGGSRGPRDITAEQLRSWSASAQTFVSKMQHFTSIFMGFLSAHLSLQKPLLLLC